MDRAERYGLGISAAAHVALFVALSLSLLSARIPKPPVADPMDVQFVDKVGPTSAAPKVSQDAPAPSEAPEQGKPDDTTPPPLKAIPVTKPEPKPTPPQPEPAKPAPPKPTPTPPKPAPPKPEVKPEPKPKPEKPAKPEKTTPDKPALAKPTKSAPAKSAPAKSAPAKPTRATGLSSDFLKDLPQDKPGTAAPKGSRLGSDFLKGLSPSKASGKAAAPHAAAISAQSMSGLVALIASKVKPCYNPPAGGADSGQITTVLSIRMNRDGSVAEVTPGAQSGVNGSNAAYARQMADAAVRAVRRCSPISGLPPELYESGWSDFDFRFRPDQMQ